jgi:hypothetical protein
VNDAPLEEVMRDLFQRQRAQAKSDAAAATAKSEPPQEGSA